MMKAICSWINDRTGLGDGWRWLATSPVPGRACFCKALPAAIVLTFCIQAVTGFFLWVYYSPSAQTAWESVYYLQYETVGGWVLRAIHHYSAHVLLALLMLLIVQSIFTRAYRAPRELVFWATVGLGLCALAAILTGDLLSWDQNGYASTKTRTGFLTFLPWVGGSLLKLAIGGPGPALGHLTLTRFFALHVGLFGAGFIGLLFARGVLARRANAVAAAEGNTTPYWPHQAAQSMIFCLAVVVVIGLLVCQHGLVLPHAGASLLSPADTDPANGYNAARPEWFLVGVYEFSHLFRGELAIIPIFIVPGLLVAIALLMPFLAKHPLGQLFNVAFTIALLIAIVGLSYYSLAKDCANPDHQRAIALEQRQARRVCDLARGEGIPPTGALTLLRNDPKTQGPRLFAQNCASCHDHAAGRDPLDDIKAEKSSAPNLAGFASRAWIAGLLDPKKIGSPQYFGNTKFRSGKMAGFVKETLGALDAAEKKNLEKAIIALSAEAALPSQKAADAKDAAIIAEGRTILTGELGCTDCHKFRDKGKLGDAPDLTGYGSAQWIAGIVRNPADKHFYGKINDRMPAYAVSETDPAQNTLNPRQIEMLTDWLRGQWYEIGEDEE
jgi:ubiquinol-cytochrome c reductase cytochrome b subunit